MVDGFVLAQELLSETLQSGFAREVTYCHGVHRFPVSVIRSEQTVGVSEAGGATVEAQRVDWIIPRAKFLWQGKLQEPARGDLIKEIVAGRTLTYEVQPVGTESHYRASGASWRVFTRLVRTE